MAVKVLKYDRRIGEVISSEVRLLRSLRAALPGVFNNDSIDMFDLYQTGIWISLLSILRGAFSDAYVKIILEDKQQIASGDIRIRYGSTVPLPLRFATEENTAARLRMQSIISRLRQDYDLLLPEDRFPKAASSDIIFMVADNIEELRFITAYMYGRNHNACHNVRNGPLEWGDPYYDMGDPAHEIEAAICMAVGNIVVTDHSLAYPDDEETITTAPIITPSWVTRPIGIARSDMENILRDHLQTRLVGEYLVDADIVEAARQAVDTIGMPPHPTFAGIPVSVDRNGFAHRIVANTEGLSSIKLRIEDLNDVGDSNKEKEEVKMNPITASSLLSGSHIRDFRRNKDVYTSYSEWLFVGLGKKIKQRFSDYNFKRLSCPLPAVDTKINTPAEKITQAAKRVSNPKGKASEVLSTLALPTTVRSTLSTIDGTPACFIETDDYCGDNTALKALADYIYNPDTPKNIRVRRDKLNELSTAAFMKELTSSTRKNVYKMRTEGVDSTVGIPGFTSDLILTEGTIKSKGDRPSPGVSRVANLAVRCYPSINDTGAFKFKVSIQDISESGIYSEIREELENLISQLLIDTVNNYLIIPEHEAISIFYGATGGINEMSKLIAGMYPVTRGGTPEQNEVLASNIIELSEWLMTNPVEREKIMGIPVIKECNSTEIPKQLKISAVDSPNATEVVDFTASETCRRVITGAWYAHRASGNDHAHGLKTTKYRDCVRREMNFKSDSDVLVLNIFEHLVTGLFLAMTPVASILNDKLLAVMADFKARTDMLDSRSINAHGVVYGLPVQYPSFVFSQERYKKMHYTSISYLDLWENGEDMLDNSPSTADTWMPQKRDHTDIKVLSKNMNLTAKLLYKDAPDFIKDKIALGKRGLCFLTGAPGGHTILSRYGHVLPIEVKIKMEKEYKDTLNKISTVNYVIASKRPINREEISTSIHAVTNAYTYGRMYKSSVKLFTPLDNMVQHADKYSMLKDISDDVRSSRIEYLRGLLIEQSEYSNTRGRFNISRGNHLGSTYGFLVKAGVLEFSSNVSKDVQDALSGCCLPYNCQRLFLALLDNERNPCIVDEGSEFLVRQRFNTCLSQTNELKRGSSVMFYVPAYIEYLKKINEAGITGYQAAISMHHSISSYDGDMFDRRSGMHIAIPSIQSRLFEKTRIVVDNFAWYDSLKLRESRGNNTSRNTTPKVVSVVAETEDLSKALFVYWGLAQPTTQFFTLSLISSFINLVPLSVFVDIMSVKNEVKPLEALDSSINYVEKEITSRLKASREKSMKESVEQNLYKLRTLKENYLSECRKLLPKTREISREVITLKRGDALLSEEKRLKRLMEKGDLLGVRYNEGSLMFRLPPAYVWSGPFIHSLGFIIVEIAGLYTNNFKVHFYNPDHLAKVTPTELKRYLSSGESRTIDAAHVRAGVGCLGNLGGMIDSAIREGDIIDLVSLCRSYVNAANEDDMYGRSIVYWPPIPATIHNVVKYGMVNRLNKDSILVVDEGIRSLHTFSVTEFAKLVEANRANILDTSFKYSDVITWPNKLTSSVLRNALPKTMHSEAELMIKSYVCNYTIPTLLSEEEIVAQIESLNRMLNMSKKDWNRMVAVNHPDSSATATEASYSVPNMTELKAAHAKRIAEGRLLTLDGSEVVKRVLNDTNVGDEDDN